MERIRLTADEKRALRLLREGVLDPESIGARRFARAVRSLQAKGLALAVFSDGGALSDACLSAAGDEYFAVNPRLTNPVDWRWAVATAISTGSLLLAALALLIACSIIK